MILIYVVSTDLGSSNSTSRFLVPLLTWLLGEPSPETIHMFRVIIRKCGHLFEYAVLAILCYRAFAGGRLRVPWNTRNAAMAAIVAIVYASTDECHQSFVTSRTGSATDVLIDAVGALGGLTLVYLWSNWRNRPE